MYVYDDVDVDDGAYEYENVDAYVKEDEYVGDECVRFAPREDAS